MGHILAADGLLQHQDDIFFLTVAEVLGAAEGAAVTTDISALATLRRTEQEKFAKQPDPPPRILLRGSVTDPARRLSQAPATPRLDNDTERTGTPCGGGIAIGVVRLIRDPLTEQLRPGEILVARHTDPGWISHFAHAAAVVVERGSVLSHSAIVSRELGIPCVVALPGACAWLRTGEKVQVDGSRGVVKKCHD
jgi:pyruvate,water dikinase